jgi:hypothetical protein
VESTQQRAETEVRATYGVIDDALSVALPETFER